MTAVPAANLQQPACRCIVIGASAGGLKALTQLIEPLTPDFPLPLVCVIHLHPHSQTAGFVYNLRKHSKLQVHEANEKVVPQPATLYLAPANYHILIENDGSLALSIDSKVNFSRPSIDVLFTSAAAIYRQHLIGILLSGGSIDGVAGLQAVQRCGGLTIAQDPLSAEVPLMPQSAINAGCVDTILSPAEIGHWLTRKVKSQS